MTALTTHDLFTALSSHDVTAKYFDGVFALDEVAAIRRRPRLIVMNTDPSWKNGQHWMVIFFPARRHVVEVFDSLGSEERNYPAEIMRFLWRFASVVKLSRKRVQPADTGLCGLYCLYFAACRCSKNSMDHILENMPSPEWIRSCIPVYFGLT